MRRNTLIIGAIVGLLLSLATVVQPASAAPAFRALLFTKTTGYRHDSIPAGVTMFRDQAAANNFEVVHSEDSAVFTPANLATFDVLIMFQTSGMVWTTAAQRQAVEGYLASGKGIVAIHNATDMGIENEYPWWDQTINAGAHMPEHSPGVLPGTAVVADKKHPSTAGLPDRWNRSEEWYNFDRNPRGDVHVLVTADERTYNPGSRAMGPDHPISWCRTTGGGRVWATGMGHAIASYSEAGFRNHVLGGVKWAAGSEPGDCGGTVWSNFEKRTLDDNTADPMALMSYGPLLRADGSVGLTLTSARPDKNGVVGRAKEIATKEEADALRGLVVRPHEERFGRAHPALDRLGEVGVEARVDVAGGGGEELTERPLIDGLFFDGRTRTDTKTVKKHYEKTGFDPASTIGDALGEMQGRGFRVRVMFQPRVDPRCPGLRVPDFER